MEKEYTLSNKSGLSCKSPQKETNLPLQLFVCQHIMGFVYHPNKTADAVVSAYLKEVYCKFGGTHKMLSDNKNECTNKLLPDVAFQLGITHIFASPYRSQANGKIENPLRSVLRNLHLKQMLNGIKWFNCLANI